MIHARKDYMSIQDSSGRIPENEPVFLIRGKDISGPEAVEAWADIAERYGADPTITTIARYHANVMREYQVSKGSQIPDMRTNDANLPEHYFPIITATQTDDDKTLEQILIEIFQLQRELNIVIGRDTVGAPNKQEWLFQYNLAVESELHELKLGDTDENRFVEAIDILHFVVSMCHIMNITAIDFYQVVAIDGSSSIMEARKFGKWNPLYRYLTGFWDSEATRPTLDSLIDECRYITGEIHRCINWKWWSKSVKEDMSRQFKEIIKPEDVTSHIRRLFMWLINIFVLLDKTPLDVLKVYRLKHQANLDRQANGYDHKTKTEDDNLKIEAAIASGTVDQAVEELVEQPHPTTMSNPETCQAELVNVLAPKDAARSYSDAGLSEVNKKYRVMVEDVSARLADDKTLTWALHSCIATAITDILCDVASYSVSHYFGNICAARIMDIQYNINTADLFPVMVPESVRRDWDDIKKQLASSSLKLSIPKLSVKVANDSLRKAMTDDHGYAIGWLSNLACSFSDTVPENVLPQWASMALGNHGAAHFMKKLFGINMYELIPDHFKGRMTVDEVAEKLANDPTWVNN